MTSPNPTPVPPESTIPEKFILQSRSIWALMLTAVTGIKSLSEGLGLDYFPVFSDAQAGNIAQGATLLIAMFLLFRSRFSNPDGAALTFNPSSITGPSPPLVRMFWLSVLPLGVVAALSMPASAEPVTESWGWTEATNAVSYDVHLTDSGAWTSAGSVTAVAGQDGQIDVTVERGTPYRLRVFGVGSTGAPGPMSELSEIRVAGEDSGPVGQPGTFFIIPAGQ